MFHKILTCLILFVLLTIVLGKSKNDNGRIKRASLLPSYNTSLIDTIFSKPDVARRQCETDQIEYRLAKLEVQVAEKAETLRSELRENNRRLQTLEWRSAEVQTALEALKNELGRSGVVNQPIKLPHVTAHTASNDQQLNRSFDDLTKAVQLAVTALRIINNDIDQVKHDLSEVANATSLMQQNQDQLVTKEFLNRGLSEIKQHQVYEKSAKVCPISNQRLLPKNCKEVQESGNNISGIYRIQPEQSQRSFLVLCDLKTSGGGWTLIHNRFDGSQNFYLNWHNYKHGFGNLGGEFWLGLDFIHQLTGFNVNELLIEIEDLNETKAFAHYSVFSIASEIEGYSLKVLSGYAGNAGDSLIYHAGSKFSTKDLDQDSWPEGSCAQAHNGAWWYRGCDTSNLNGKYLGGNIPDAYLYQGMYWGEFRGPQYSLLKARMMVRPKDEKSPPTFSEEILNLNM